jgi:CRISPR-associated protein Cst1
MKSNERLIYPNFAGNPFVDTGLGVIAALARLEGMHDLTLDHMKAVYGNGDRLAAWNSKLKTFTQIFGTNNPLFQTGYGFKKGKGPSDANIAIYKSTLKGFLSEIGKSEYGPRCWACGTPSSFDFAQVCKKAVKENRKELPDDKWVGRDWFPLAGSLGSDAQALPAASQSAHICPRCLFAVHYLPMGVVLLNGRLAVFQSTSTEFWYDLIRDIVEQVGGQVQAGNYETLGKKEGSKALLVRLFGVFERLQNEKHRRGVPEGTALYVWRFSNSGASPECTIEEVPNPALLFLWDVVNMGLRREIEYLIESEGKNPRLSIFRCILEGRDYPNLYPQEKRVGASSKLFELYQTHICNHSVKCLQTAYKLAEEVSKKVGQEELKRLQRSEAFQEGANRNIFRSMMVQMAERDELTLEDYLNLFPVREGENIAVAWDGWNLIRFYLHHTNEDDRPEGVTPTGIRPILTLIRYYAGTIYNHYVKERGRERFQREILGQLRLDKLGIQWLRNQFTQLAEVEDGFTYGHWSKLCKPEDRRFFVSELLFQMRLLWSQWVYEGQTALNIPARQDGESTNGLPEQINALIEVVCTDYIDRKSLRRFHRDILLRLLRRELGLFWFKEKLTKHIFEDVQPISEEEWEDFLVDDEGQSLRAERLFQLHLALANLYRVKKLSEDTRR